MLFTIIKIIIYAYVHIINYLLQDTKLIAYADDLILLVQGESFPKDASRWKFYTTKIKKNGHPNTN